MYTLSMQQKVTVVTALVEGNSIRSIERMTGIHRDTIMRLLVSVGENCAALLDSKMRNLPSRFIQCDEIWTYVVKKERRIRIEDPVEIGDQWVFVALDAETKAVVSYTVGKRSPVNTQLFIRDLYSRLKERPQLTTDGWAPYRMAIDEMWGTDVDFAQLIKIYGRYGASDDRRYSPAKLMEVVSKVFSGNPDPRQISTSYVERQNLTMRMAMRRFTRLTNAFSKKLENLKAALALHFAHYNFVRVHRSLRITPAMAVGISNSIWGIESLIFGTNSN